MARAKKGRRRTPGLAILGRRVDLNTANDLSKYYRAEVLREAEPVYVAA